MSTLPRTAVLTFREAEPWVWMTSLVAMENLVVDAYDARVVTLRPRGGAIPRYLADRNGQRLLGARLGLPAYELVGADGPRVDVLVIICNDFFQLGRLETTPAFSRLADRIVVYIAEFWPDDAVLFRRFLKNVGSHFDVVLSTVESSIPVLRSATRATVAHLPDAVDVAAITSVQPRGRAIDVGNIGRKDPGQHESLTRWAADGTYWYFSDATPPGRVRSFPAHQRHLADLLTRSRAWVTNRARFDHTSRSGDEHEVGLRFYEALAGGCLLTGSFPSGTYFDETFAHLPGLVPFPLGAQEVPEALQRALSDDEALARVAAVHQREALLRHDVAHRVRTLASVAGLPEPPLVRERIDALRLRADAMT